MAAYPVSFHVTRPEKFDRVQLLLRVVVLAALSCLGATLGAVMGFAYFALPLVAAILISQRGPAGYIERSAPRVARALAWLMAVFAYFFLLTDRLPLDEPDISASLEVAPRGTPTVGAALLRFITSLPSAFIFGLLCLIAYIVWLISALLIVITETYPPGLYDFQCGVLRWQARLLAYHAALVDKYPPFSFEPGAAEGALRSGPAGTLA
ncbi:MAG: DUF4389 domain-containing protein [Polyangiaceae bacterium]|nr:DUF4389 domain-containing protein [Polyangiaceae bacterium]NUQ73648.1 DUF4389 domain-containing protein [Polyangiaceae bacterium]